MTLSHNDDDSRDCPSASDLRAFAERRLQPSDAAPVQAHLAGCEACTDTVEALRTTPAPAVSSEAVHRWRQLGRESAAAFTRVWATAQLEDLDTGQLWTTAAPTGCRDVGGRIVVLVDTRQSLSAAPISLELGQRGDRDVWVRPNESPLGYDFMVETWNVLRTEQALLKRYLGRLGPAPMEAVQQLVRGGGAIRLGDRAGPPLHAADDPRRAFQERERAACAFLDRPSGPPLPPVRATAGPAILDGAAVRARRRTLDLRFEALGQALVERGFGDDDIGLVAEAERQGQVRVGPSLVEAIATILQVDQDALAAQAPTGDRPSGARQAFAGSDVFRRRVVDLAARRGADPAVFLPQVQAAWLSAAARESEAAEHGDEDAWLAILDHLTLRVIDREEERRR